MFERHQHKPEFTAFLRVGLKPLDCESGLVGDALAARLSGVPKFKVFESVIAALTVDVMDIFVWKKRPAKVFFHDVAMFHDRSLGAVDAAGNGNPDVAGLFNVPSKFTAIEFFSRLCGLMRGFAGLVTVFLLRKILNVSGGSLVFSTRILLAALKASERLFLFSANPARKSGALPRAIHRVVLVNDSVSGKEPRLDAEWLAALLTVEHDALDATGRPSMNGFMSVLASTGTPAPSFLFAQATRKGFSALFARFFNISGWAGHSGLLSVSA